MDRETIIKRLETMGYTYNPQTDEYALEFAEDRVTERILNAINDSEIPDGLSFLATDMVCAEFLKLKKGFGQLTEIQFEQIARTIKLGDTNIEFANDASPEQKFDAAINYLLTGHEDEFARYRKLVW